MKERRKGQVKGKEEKQMKAFIIRWYDSTRANSQDWAAVIAKNEKEAKKLLHEYLRPDYMTPEHWITNFDTEIRDIICLDPADIAKSVPVVIFTTESQKRFPKTVTEIRKEGRDEKERQEKIRKDAEERRKQPAPPSDDSDRCLDDELPGGYGFGIGSWGGG